MNSKVQGDKVLPPKMEQIYFLAEKGDAQRLLECLRTGGNINFVHPTSTDSPLMIACRRGYAEVVRVCLDYGAKNDPHPDFGQTALHAAVASGRQACAAIILEVAQQSEADSIISNLTDQYGQTPLHTACIIGSVQITELLLHHGARISSIDTYGQTPLHLCAGSGHKKVLAILLDHEGDVLIDLPDVYGNSPLHHAAYHGKLDCAKLLLETAANVNARNNEGLTAYNLAIIHGHHQISAVILEYRSDAGGGADRFSRESTSYYSDSHYGTPMAVRASDIPTPNLRRAQTYGGAESSTMYDQLPRPHTLSMTSPSPPSSVASPNTSSKQFRGNKTTSPRSSLFDREVATSSPYSDSGIVQGNRREGSGSVDDDILESGGVYGGYRVVSQLSTPLIVREKRSSQMVHSASKDDRFVETPTKVFSGPKQVGSSAQLYPTNPPSTPQRKYSISSDSNSDDGNYPSSHSKPAMNSPSKKSPLKDDYNSYAEPLEVFDAFDMTWYVYLTEQGDVYYLDSTNSHSQWEDPREHGVIAYAQEGYDENTSYPSPSKGASPGKLAADYAPPLSPAFKTTPLFDGDGDAEAAQQDGSERVLPVRSLFGDEEDTTLEGSSQHTSEHTPSRSLMSAKDSSGSSLLSASPEAYSLPYEPISQSHVQNVKQLLQQANEAGGDLDNKAKPATKDAALFTKTKVAPPPQSQPLANAIAPATEDMRVLCEEYVAMLRQGKSLQDIRGTLEQTGYGNIAIAKIMSTLDDCLMMEDLEDGEAVGAIQSTSSGVRKEDKQPEVQMSAAERTKLRLKELQESQSAVTKYVKMIQMGVLPMSVISKMKLDSIDPQFIDLMEDALGLHDEQHSKAKEKTADGWLPQERLKNSIWAFDTTEQTLLADQELAELESMFRTQRESRSRNVAAAKPPKLILQVIEGKRAQNIAIGLVTFRSIGSHVDILKAICALNNLDGNLHVDNLENLKTLLPTDSELKLLHRLNHPTHPSEMFFQVVLLFYPELPFRLSTLITCLAFNDYTVSIDRKLRMIMNAINQILSSTKLAKILQKLLVAGRVMMQPGGKGNKIVSADPKTSVLEQLLQVSTMKSVDKKTSLMDYVVKTLFDKNEEGLLLVIDDLSLLGDNTAPLNSLEVLHDLKQIDKQMDVLNQELLRARSLSSVQEIFSSPTAKAISDKYTAQLQTYISNFEEHISMLHKRKLLFLRKIQALMEYFGEDVKQTDSSRIFNALKEFRRTLAFSKESVEWKLYRSQQS